jgi:hypothetical protein
MANVDTPFGLRPIRHRNGAPYNGAVNPYYLRSDYAVATFIGDPVVKTGTSNLVAVSAAGVGDFDIGTLPTINKATAGATNRITGVIVGFAPLPNDLTKQYNPASTERVALVCDDPDVIFEIQSDGALSAAQVSLNAVLIYTSSGSTVSGLSGAELDSGTATAPAADATYQLMIQRASNTPGNDITAAYCKVEVVISNHSEASGSTTTSTGILGV